MSEAALPAVVVLHDGVPGAVGDRLRLTEVDRDRCWLGTQDELESDSLRPVMQSVGANERLLIVHVLGPLDNPDNKASTPTHIRRILATILGDYPLRRPRQWVVQAAGPKWDRAEVTLARRLHTSASDLRLGGVMIVVQSSAASVAQTAEEEQIACADIVHTLRACPGLEQELAENPSVWLVGVASITFSAPGRVARLASDRSTTLVRTLLAPAPPNDPSAALAEQHVDELDLTSDRDQRRLASGAEGGSILTPFRLSSILRREQFEQIPIGEWPAVVEAATDEALIIRLPPALKQISANVGSRAKDLAQILDNAILSHFEECRNLEQTESFCRSQADAIDAARRRLEQRRAETLPDTSEALRDRLRRFAEHFPYGPAVALRFMLLALVTLLVAQWPAKSLSGWGPTGVHLVARLAAAAMLAVGWVFYAWRWRRLTRTRDAAIRHAERTVIARIDREILDARLAMLSSLVRRIRPSTALTGDEVPWIARLSQLRQALQAGKGATGKNDSLGASRFALELPDASIPAIPSDKQDAVDNADRKAADLVVEHLVARSLIVEPAEFSQWLAEAWSSSYDGIFASALGVFLHESPTACDRARNVLSAELAPTGADSYSGSQQGRVARYLCAPGGEGGALARILVPDQDDRERSLAPPFALTAVHPSVDANFVALLHTFDATAVTQTSAKSRNRPDTARRPKDRG